MTWQRRISLAWRLTIGNRAGEGTRPSGAVIGIAIAIIPIMVVVHIASGMITGIAERFIETGTYHIRAHARSEGMPDYEDHLSSLAAIEGIRYAGIERTGYGLIYTADARSGVQIRAVDPGIYELDKGFSRFVELDSGEFRIAGDNELVIGRSIAETLSLNTGDEVRVLTLRSLPGGGVIPRVSTFIVSGIVSTGYQELDRLWAFMNYERGSRILPPDESRAVIGIKVDYPFALQNDLFRDSPERIAAMEETWSGVIQNLGRDFRVRSWFEEEQSRYISFGTTRSALIVVMVLIMAVATVNISSSMVLLVLSKQHDIGVMKALGASPRDIQSIFMLVGLWVGIIGAVIGSCIGILIALFINGIMRLLEIIVGLVTALFSGGGVQDGSIIGGEFYLETIPVELLPGSILLIFSAALVLAVVSSIVPSWKAARVRPLEVFYRR
ncbi:ABC transporter permease [Spirochaeta dissipatitropha]